MIGSIFLIPNGTFFIELVTMVVILLLMTKYILPPLNKALESRQEKIRESLAAADAAKAEAVAAGDERATLLNAARDQAREIVAAAQATSDQVRAEAAGRGQAEYDRILANANAEDRSGRVRAGESNCRTRSRREFASRPGPRSRRRVERGSGKGF